MKSHSPILNYLKFNRVLRCSKELERLSKVENPELRRKLILDAKTCVIDAISEIAVNCLKGNIPLNSCDFESLSKYKKILRLLSKKTPVQRRRKIIIQKGGQLLSLLIPPALSLISSIISKYLTHKIK